MGVKSLLLTNGAKKDRKGELARIIGARKTLGETIKDTRGESGEANNA
jgi:hypothetical protein